MVNDTSLPRVTEEMRRAANEVWDRTADMGRAVAAALDIAESRVDAPTLEALSLTRTVQVVASLVHKYESHGWSAERALACIRGELATSPACAGVVEHVIELFERPGMSDVEGMLAVAVRYAGSDAGNQARRDLLAQFAAVIFSNQLLEKELGR